MYSNILLIKGDRGVDRETLVLPYVTGLPIRVVCEYNVRRRFGLDKLGLHVYYCFKLYQLSNVCESDQLTCAALQPAVSVRVSRPKVPIPKAAGTIVCIMICETPETGSGLSLL